MTLALPKSLGIDVANPQPGIYPGLAAATYHRINAASAHGLADFKRSPAHRWWGFSNPKTQTPAMALGEAVHYAILEPGEFCERYCICPELDRRTKEGKAAWAGIEAAAAGRPILRIGDAEICKNIGEAVHAHPRARALLASAEERESTLIWIDRDTGVLAKARPDGLCRNIGTVIDIKTTEDAGRDHFEREIFNYSYHRQAAFYLEGLAAVGGSFDAFVLIAVEKTPPFGVAIYQLDDESLEAGRKEFRELLPQWAECVRTGQWPGYDQKINHIGLPRWAARKILDGDLI